MKLNSFFQKWHSLITFVLVIIQCSLTVTAQEKNEPIWHPEAIYIVWTDMKLDFELPDEKDRSGVANLLFEDRTSGNIYLLDFIRDNPHYQTKKFGFKSIAHIKDARYYTRFEPGSYDAILLYNNGKYIRYDNITFSKDVHKVIDMREEPVQLADSESRNWLTLRKFNTIIGERTLNKDYTTVSDKKVSGYLFCDYGGGKALSDAIISYLTKNNKVRSVNSAYDGYFEIDVDDNDIKPILEINSIGNPALKIDVKANSGYFVVLQPIVISEEELRNIKTGPLIKKNK